MKITAEQPALLGALKKAKLAIKQNSIPALTCVLISAKPEGITLTTSDIDSWLTIDLDGHVKEEGELLISCERLMALTQHAGADIVITSNEHAGADIVSARDRARIHGLPIVEFVEEPHNDQVFSIVEIPAPILRDALNKVTPAMSIDGGRPALMGVHLLTRDDKLIIEACNGVALHLVETDIEPENRVDALIPIDQVSRLETLIGPVDGIVTFAISERKIKVTAEGFAFQFSQIAAVYPNTLQVVPAQSKKTVTCNRGGLLSAIRKASVFGNIDANRRSNVVLNIDKKGIAVSGATHEVGSLESFLDDPQKVEVKICVAAELLKGVFSANSDEMLTFECVSASDPIVVREPGFLAVATPLRPTA